jgi:hypothetical protein
MFFGLETQNEESTIINLPKFIFNTFASLALEKLGYINTLFATFLKKTYASL